MHISDLLLKGIKSEYKWILISILCYIALIVLIAVVILLIQKHLNDLPLFVFLLIAYGRVVVGAIIFSLSFFIYPLVVLVKNWADLMAVSPLWYQILIFAVMLIPIPLGVCVFVVGRKVLMII